MFVITVRMIYFTFWVYLLALKPNKSTQKEKKSFLMSSWRYGTRSNDKASHHVRIIDEFFS